MLVTDSRILKDKLERQIMREISQYEKQTGVRVTGIKIDRVAGKDGFTKPFIEKRIKIRCEI